MLGHGGPEDDEGRAYGRAWSGRPGGLTSRTRVQGGLGTLTLPAQAAASSSPRHRATSCTLGSNRPRGGGLPSAPKSWEASGGGVVREQPRVSHRALTGSPAVALLPLGVTAQSREPRGAAGGKRRSQGPPARARAQRHSRRRPCCGPGGAGAPALAAAAAGTSRGPAPSSAAPAAAPPSPAPAPPSASAATRGTWR